MKLQYEDLKNKTKEEIETEFTYLVEEIADLRNKIEAGKWAEGVLRENETRVVELMDAYLGTSGKTIIPIADYETLKKEMERADSLYGVHNDIKELKDMISRSNYQLDQKEIFRILDNVDSGIEEDMERK